MSASGSIPTTGGSGTSASAVRVTITNYGARADNSTDCYPAFLLAYQAALGIADPDRYIAAEIYWPGAELPYLVSKPLNIEHPYIRMVGDGDSSRIENQAGGPVVLLGITTTELVNGGATELELDATFRPDLYGLLDASGAQSAGTRWGFRTKNEATILLAHCPLTHGKPDQWNQSLDGWSGIQKFLIEFAVSAGDGTYFAGGGTGGFWMFGGYGSNQGILCLDRGGGQNQYDIRLTDEFGNEGSVSIQPLSATGLQRLAWQFDLTGATPSVIAFVDGVQVAVNTSGAFWSVAGPKSLLVNNYNPWIFGANSNTADNRPPLGAYGASTGIDYICAGFQIYLENPYANDGVGQPQRRLDAGTINDNYRYGQGGKTDNLILAQLYRTDSPVSDPTNRRVTFYNGNSGGLFHGYMLQIGQYDNTQGNGGISGNALTGLQLVGRGNKFQPVVEVGPVLDLDIIDCRITNGTFAIACLPTQASYPITIDRCRLSGGLGCVYMAWADVRIESTRFLNSGRCAVRSWASNTRIIDTFVLAVNEQIEYGVRIHAGLYGGYTVIEQMAFDAEGNTASEAAFGFDHFDAQPCSVSIDTVYLGSMAQTGSVIDLFGINGFNPLNHAKATITATNINPPSKEQNWVYALWQDYASWTGTIQINSNASKPTNGPSNPNISIT